jgi:hypothetical protein
VCTDQLLLLADRLLILRGLLLASLPAPLHRANNRADARALTCVPGDRTNRSATRRAPRRAAQALTASYGRPCLLGWWAGSDDRRINARGLLRPCVTLGVIPALLLRALAFGGIHNRLLCHGGAGKRQHSQPDQYLHTSDHMIFPFVLFPRSATQFIHSAEWQQFLAGDLDQTMRALLLVARVITAELLQGAILTASPIQALLVLHTPASVACLLAGDKEESDDGLSQGRLVGAAADTSGSKLAVRR